MELFQAGRLGDAIAAITSEVKANPTDGERRYRLFAYLCFAGELERADRQLDALASQDAQIEVGSRVYRLLLASEMGRRQVFDGLSEPMLPPDPPAHVLRRKEALAALRSKDEAGFMRLLDRAAEASPALSGSADSRSFTSIRDSDDLLGSVLEVFAGGRYLWLPFERIRSLTISAPRHMLDLLWAATDLEDVDGTRASVHVPTLYAGSWASPVDALRLGRATEWPDVAGLARAIGQRVLDADFVDSGGEGPGEIPILTLRTLTIQGGTESSREG